jgi:NAD(P)-dependent dehydrogenase (short-subunit alcohol dehydrogenase family)
LSRHTVIITGGTKGLGFATALALARAGHRVIALYANDEAAAERARSNPELAERDFVALKQDAREENADFWLRPEIESAESLVLVNNAWAPFTPRPFHLLRWADCEAALTSGLKASWVCSRAVLRPMARAGGGLIVNVLTSALQGLPPKGFAAYATAKHALRGLTLAIAAEYASRGIRAFSVSPGLMPTSLTSEWDPAFLDSARQSGQISDPAEAARRILELVESSATPGHGEDYPV